MEQFSKDKKNDAQKPLFYWKTNKKSFFSFLVQKKKQIFAPQILIISIN